MFFCEVNCSQESYLGVSLVDIKNTPGFILGWIPIQVANFGFQALNKIQGRYQSFSAWNDNNSNVLFPERVAKGGKVIRFGLFPFANNQDWFPWGDDILPALIAFPAFPTIKQRLVARWFLFSTLLTPSSTKSVEISPKNGMAP